MKTKLVFAGISLCAEHKTEDLRRFCRKYLAQNEAPEEDDLQIMLTPGMLSEEHERAQKQGTEASESLVESLALCREFCRLAIWWDVLLFHSSAIAVDGEAYLFAAPSGTGKSTHTSFWRAHLGEKAVMINDDKPFLRRENGVWFAYGSPWNGKHRLSTPMKASIKGICFLARGEENEITPTTAQEGLSRLFVQTQRAVGEAEMRKQMELLGDLAAQVPLWSLRCTASIEAAKIAYAAMAGGSK